MKKYLSFLLILCLLAFFCLSACQKPSPNESKGEETSKAADSGKEASDSCEDMPGNDSVQTDIPDSPGGDESALKVSCSEGTADCWTVKENTLYFSGLSADTVCAVSGTWEGNIVIDAGEDFKFELEMKGLSLWSSLENPITVLSGDKVTLTAKKETENFIYDTREAVTDEALHSAAIWADCDLTVGGKGSLTLISSANNGIHTKDDLEVKNLSLTVTCEDNALKGNDSVEINGARLVLIARTGDGIKTSSSDVSSKGNQRGTVTLKDCSAEIYAACDGIDASYNAEITGDTTLIIYTDKYSPYSGEVTAADEDTYYIRFTSKEYSYSVKYYNSADDFKWVDAAYKTSVRGSRQTYYYYTVPKESGYNKVQFFIYASASEQGQEEEYLACSDLLTWNESYDTFALSRDGFSLSYSWTNYTTSPQGGGPGGPGGPGGMDQGNTDKGDHSTKGIKADNEILISGGDITVYAYDDAIHANNDNELENGEKPTGNITVTGGTLTLCSNDDAVHADGQLFISGGTVRISESYEGLEGDTIVIDGGDISVISKDDGLNSTSTSGVGMSLNGGTLYVYAGGDGLDSNSRTSYQGIVFSGCEVTVISTSGGNSPIDTEQGYAYSAGRVLAVCPVGGMTNETVKCRNFNSVGVKTSMNLKKDQTLTVSEKGTEVLSVSMPCSVSALVIYLGSSEASITAQN